MRSGFPPGWTKPQWQVGIAQGVVSSGGDGIAFFTVRDAQAVQFDLPGEAIRMERAARVRRGAAQDVGRVQPLLLDENVQLALEINNTPPRAAHKRAVELLDYLGVADRANNLPDALSGGQQQRVAVARALANEPSLILADEPTAALDSHRGRQVMELFRKVAHERVSAVIVVTHDQRSLDVFDRSYEMEDGRLKSGTKLTATLKP
jgi:ABC-type lipoprotein export system ATPase subunit